MPPLDHALIWALNHALGRHQAEPLAASSPSPPDASYIGETLPLVLAGPEPTFPFKPKPVVIRPDSRLRHVYLLGSSGSGKTNLLLRLLEADLALGRSLCVVDLRGDLIERILPRLVATAPPEAWQNRLLFLDLRDAGHAVGFNPLQGEGDLYERATETFDIIKEMTGTTGVRWEETLKNTLIALAAAQWTLLEVEPLLTDSAFRAQVLAGLNDPVVRRFFRERFDPLSPSQRLQLASEVLNKITPLLQFPALRRVVGQRRALPLQGFLEGPPGQVILVSLAADRLHSAANLMGALFVSAFQSAVMGRDETLGEKLMPVHLYVDELQAMATERFETIVSQGRRFGLGLTIAHQNHHQLSMGLRAAIRGSVRTHFYFQTSASDAAESAGEVGRGFDNIPPAHIIETMIGQDVGQAFLVRRGQPHARVQVVSCPDPTGYAEQVNALKQVARTSYARSVADIERDFEVREEERAHLPRIASGPLKRSAPQSGPASPASVPASPVPEPDAPQGTTPTSSPLYEIREEKLEHFHVRDLEEE